MFKTYEYTAKKGLGKLFDKGHTIVIDFQLYNGDEEIVPGVNQTRQDGIGFYIPRSEVKSNYIMVTPPVIATRGSVKGSSTYVKDTGMPIMGLDHKKYLYKKQTNTIK